MDMRVNLQRRALRATLWVLAAALTAALPAARTSAASSPPPLLAFAAASLTDAAREIGRAYTRQTGQVVEFSFAASSTLARQIEAGAPAAVFVSADVKWMDELQRRHLIAVDTRRDIAGNRLALIAPAASRIELKIAPHCALAAALGSGRLAVGEPSSVPAGIYARAALVSLGLWQSLGDRLLPAEDVRAALEYVAHDEAPLGIVYRTDAFIEPRVRIVGLFPPQSHPPITYPAAAVAGTGAAAARFVAFLAGPQAQRIFHKYGFTTP
ncbi:MAG TPA: molybdate ABC transporter substrate-binding protein [Steroidobacteraceae bacterium]|nr:molybdate ABC transporter substrate-binding protein [Steroidobacteraceae bacterium]